MAANSTHQGTATKIQNAPARASASPDQAKPLARLLVPRRIDVIKDHDTPDTFFRLEIDDTTTFLVPLGPKLAASLIEGLRRAQHLVVPTSTLKQ